MSACREPPPTIPEIPDHDDGRPKEDEVASMKGNH